MFSNDPLLDMKQISTGHFSLAIGSDTARNSTQTKYDFPQLGVKIELPRQIFNMTDRPVVVSFTWLQEGHYLDPPAINGAQQISTLVDAGTFDHLIFKQIYRFKYIYKSA